jgi:type I restriction enzyme S subunit
MPLQKNCRRFWWSWGMSDWSSVKLADIADIRVSNVDKKSYPGEKSVRLCNYMDVYSHRQITNYLQFMEATANDAQIAKFKVELGDVLITKDSETPFDIGIPSVVTQSVENLVCGYHLALIKPKLNLIDPVFLSKVLASNNCAIYFSKYAAGSTRYGLSNGAIAKIPVNLPLLCKQQKIATILTSIDTAIEKTEALIEKYQKIKSGLMHDLFTRGVLPNGQLRPTREQAPELYQETKIGWIPREWDCNNLGKYLTSSPKNGYSPNEIDYWDGIYVLGLGCLTKNGFKPRQLKKANYKSAISSGAILNDGDFLISRANTPELVGLCGIYKDIGEKVIYPDLMMRISLSSVLDKFYFEQLMLHSSTRNQIKTLAVGTSSSMVKLNATSLKKLVIKVPNPKEQTKIVETIRPFESQIIVLTLQLNKLQSQKLGLMQDLLTGKVPVTVSENADSQENAYA